MGKTIPVQINDDVFLERLKNDENSFSFGKYFTVTLRTTISRRKGSRRESKTYEIIRVHHESLD